MSKKLTYEQVKEMIEQTGCELISKEYKQEHSFRFKM